MDFDIEKLTARFNAKMESDKVYERPWLADWAYQTMRKKRGRINKDGLVKDFFTISGLQDLVGWYNWMPEYANYLPADTMAPLIAESRKYDEAVFKSLGLDFDFAVVVVVVHS
jgi:hypothetical protein